MLRTERDRQMSLHCMLYDKIPEDHLLKQVSRAVDFSFINELLGILKCVHPEEKRKK